MMKKLLAISFILGSMTFSGGVFAQSLVNCSGDQFDPEGYLLVNPDVKAAGVDACEHYKSHGKDEGRNPNPKNHSEQNTGTSGGNDGLINCSGDQFDPEGYLLVNPDVKAADIDACAHYTSHGKKEGRSPNPKNRGGQNPGPSSGGPANPPVNPPTTTNPPVNPSNGNPTKSLSYSGVNGMVQYQFYFKSNGNTPPTTPTNNNGYIFVHIPSHAVIAKGSISPDARPKIEFQIIDSDGNEVVYLKDTVSGYHPNYFNLPIPEADVKASFEKWKNNFNGFGPFGSPEDRGNNHNGDLFNFHLKEGVYKWIYKNIGNTPNNIRAGFVRTNQDDFYETIAPGQTVIKELHLFKRRAKQGGDETFDLYKLNTNYY